MILAIVQARMGSTRLPGKSMMPLAGKPNLGWVLERLSTCHSLNRIVVATSTHSADDPIDTYCGELGCDCYRGSESDVLDRYYQCAARYSPTIIVRITGDCPLIDPVVVDDCVNLFLAQEQTDCYVSNCIERTHPDGLDVEVFSFESLKNAWKSAHMASEREHVTVYIREHSPVIHLKLLEGDYSELRLTLDHEEDAQVIEALITALHTGNPRFGLAEMVEFLESHPEIRALNAHYDPNEGLKKSLREDYIVESTDSKEGDA